VSHDLRNPLTVARGYLETSRETRDFDQVAEAEAALDRMETLIDDALTLAREGRAVDDRDLHSLAAVVEDAWATSQTAGGSLVVDADDVQVYADRDRLRRLFENLFRNAADHGPEDVTVRVRRDAGTVCVDDDGPGLPDGDVFERGFTTARDGTGLGLAIVESIAEAHGWSVSTGESPEGGARFRIEGIDLAADTEDEAVE